MVFPAPELGSPLKLLDALEIGQWLNLDRDLSAVRGAVLAFNGKNTVTLSVYASREMRMDTRHGRLFFYCVVEVCATGEVGQDSLVLKLLTSTYPARKNGATPSSAEVPIWPEDLKEYVYGLEHASLLGLLQAHFGHE